MANIKFRVPTSSLGELKKIITGYAHLEKSVDLTSLSKLVGIAGTTISTNNPFLVEVGIIDKGKAKTVTPLGKQLGRAIEHKRQEENKQAWQEVVKSNEFLSNLVSTIRIKGGMTESDLASHILFAADLKKNKQSSTGANTIIGILKEASLLVEENGKVVVATSSNTVVNEAPDSATPAPANDQPPGVMVPAKLDSTPPFVPASATMQIAPTIAINIQLQLPETENVTVYENLFAALRKNLLNSEEKAND